MRPSAEGPRWRKAIAAGRRGRRGLFVFVGSTLYVAVAAAQSEGEGKRGAWTAAIVALPIAFAATRRARAGSRGETVEDGERRLGAVSFATWGLALAIASLGGRNAWASVFGAIGALIAAGAAYDALDGLPPPMGVAASLPPFRKTLRSVVVATLGVPVALGIAGSAWPRLARAFSAAGFSHEVLSAWAAAYAFVVLGAMYGDRLRKERMVLGAVDRLRTAFASIVGIGAVACAAIVVGQEAPGPVFRVAVGIAGVSASAIVLERDALRFARIGRRALTLLLFGGPVVLLGAIAVEGAAGAGPLAVALSGAAALAIGTIGEWLERPLRPAEGRWLDAVALAHDALARADPETSVRDALAALRAAAGSSSEPPELWSLDPTRVLTVDGAGYPRERAAELPPLLLQVAAGEPELTARIELLEALVVRRPDLRPLARWMDERGALSATLVMREGDVCGVLVAPRGGRGAPLTLEEARALRSLADALSGACAGKSALARSLARERETATRAEVLEHALARSEHDALHLGGGRSLAVEYLADSASAGLYSPAARMAQTALDRRMKMRAPIVVVAPASVDPVPPLARAHLSGARPAAPFVVALGTASKDRDEARWRDPLLSPLAFAQGGLLVLVDGAALPVAIQRLVAQALAERLAPWGASDPLDVVPVLTSVLSPAELLRTGRLDPALLARLDDAFGSPIVLPPLGERAEDLRPLLIDRLAREGLRQRGTPVGIDDAAFARLAEYAFPGDQAELETMARRLVEKVAGDVVRAGDVDALGLDAALDSPRVNVRASHSVS